MDANGLGARPECRARQGDGGSFGAESVPGTRGAVDDYSDETSEEDVENDDASSQVVLNVNVAEA